MMVFCNTTPFIALSAVNQLALLPKLFGKIYVVDVVADECARGGPISVPDLASLEWVEIVQSKPCESLILFELDKGEKHTLDMAKRMLADKVIIDEKLGRDLGEYLGLNVTGTLGVLLKAKQQGLIESFSDCAYRMQQHGIRYNTELLSKLVRQMGEGNDE